MYIEFYNEFRKHKEADKVNINDDIVFEIELIKQIEVNIDYILSLIKKYHDTNCTDKEILISSNKAISSSIELRNKKDLIIQFIDSLNTGSDVYEDFVKFMDSKKKEELDKIIEEENLNKEATYEFIKRSFESGMVETTGTSISKYCQL